MKCPWYVYIIKTENDKLYTGITTDYFRRFFEHAMGVGGAKYTRANPPLHFAYLETCTSRQEAAQREAAIKALTRTQKLKLIKSLALSED